MPELTEQQREFCREVVKGLTPRAAYVKVFDCKDSAASAGASRMLKKEQVVNEINRLQELTREMREARRDGRDERAIWCRLDKQLMLQRIVEEAMETHRYVDAIGAIRELNKMDGDYAQPDGVQVNVAQGVSLGDIVAQVMGADGKV